MHTASNNVDSSVFRLTMQPFECKSLSLGLSFQSKECLLRTVCEFFFFFFFGFFRRAGNMFPEKHMVLSKESKEAMEISECVQI